VDCHERFAGAGLAASDHNAFSRDQSFDQFFRRRRRRVAHERKYALDTEWRRLAVGFVAFGILELAADGAANITASMVACAVFTGSRMTSPLGCAGRGQSSSRMTFSTYDGGGMS